MSPLLRKIVVFIPVAFVQLSLLAQEVPPPPQRTPPVGLPLPIDENILVLIVAGLMLGAFFAIYRELKNKSIS